MTDVGLATKISHVREALAIGEGIIPQVQVDSANAVLDEAMERHELVGGRTVVALVGGTGSGKSSLFNALAYSAFAEVGPLRPTTRRPAAATWGSDSAELLDYLGIRPEERIFRDTILAASSEAEMEGLVLIDMPDQDSVEEDNATVVDELVPVVDLLVWVVDPQKYADNILHERYLGPLVTRSDAMIVVINHADAVTPEGLARVQTDVRRLLDEAGLESVEIYTSAVPEDRGVAEIRQRIRLAVADPSTADTTAAVLVSGLADGLLRRFAEAEPELGDETIAPTVDALVRASGTDAAAESVERSLSRVAGGSVAHPGAPARAAVAAIGSGWAGHAKHGLPKPWARAVDRALPSVETLTDAVADAVVSIPVPYERVREADRSLIGATAAFVAGLAFVVVGSLLGWPGALLAVIAVVAVATAAGLGWSSVRKRRQVADEKAAQYSQATRARVTAAVADSLLTPTREVLDRHRRARELLEAARG
ncbi:MAG TPA: GTPase [Actinomycetaceae bacterium]|nr:GTPase [Actinomycetaceae bacterium]